MAEAHQSPRRALRVQTTTSAEAIDFRAWARAYIAAVLALEGYHVPTVTAEAASA